jgi:WD40 repeat protein
MATGGEDGTVRLWDLSTRKERAILTGHTDSVVDVAFSPDGKIMASAGSDGSVRLWDGATGRERASLIANAQPKDNGKRMRVLALAFSPAGRLLASGGSDKAVTLWDVATGKQRDVLQELQDICSLAITADGKLLVSRTDHGMIIVRELSGGKELRRFGGDPWQSPRGLNLLLLGPDGKTLASNGITEDKVKLWDLTTGEERATLKADVRWPVYSMAFAREGKVLAGTTMYGARMVFWDKRSGQLLGTLHFPGEALSIAFSPDGKTLASAHADGRVKLWEWEKLIPKK